MAGAPASDTPLDSRQATPAYCQGVYRGDTSTGANQIERYPCRPDWPETGPEQLYQLRLSQTQPLTLTLSHAAQPGLDLDLFLLEDGELERCHAADATLILAAAPPGEHIIVVDGFDGSQGAYVLEIACSEPPLATATPTATAAPTATPTPTASPTPGTTPTATPTRARLAYDHYLPAQHHRYPPPTPEPVTLVLQGGVDGYAGLSDAHIDAWNPAANYANVDRLSLRQPDVVAPVLRFDLTGVLPEGAHIVEATLSLWALTQTNENTATVGLYRLNQAWQVDEVNWLQANSGQAWVEPGANASPEDREANPRSVQDVNTTAHWYEWNATTLVQDWLYEPTSNHGVVLKAFGAPRVHYAFASTDYHNPAARPRLTIRFWVLPAEQR